MKISRSEDEVLIEWVSQTDLKISIPNALVNTLLPKKMYEWCKKLEKYMMDHYDEL